MKRELPTIMYDYQTLVADLPVAIYICDAEGRITFFNRAAVELWGREPELGKDMWCGSWKIYRPDGTPLPLDECPMALTLKERRAVIGEEIIIEREDGIRLDILPHPKPIFDDLGELVGAVNMLVDVTEKRTQEKELRQSENQYKRLSEWLERKVKNKNIVLKKSEDRYHKMVEEVQDYAILLLDKEGDILNWNRGAEKIKGYTEAEIIGKNFRIFYQDEDRINKLPEKLIMEATINGRAMHEGWRLRKNREKFWGSIVITALHNDRNEVIGFSKVTRDLTERKIAEELIKKKAQELEFQNHELEQFVFIASHDLQEPLRKIQVFSGLLEKNIGDKESTLKFIGKINASAKRLSTLIKDVLHYSRLSKSEQLEVPVDLTMVLKNALEDFELLIEQRKAVIKHTALPVITGIPIQLHQLFTNLLSNAIKFSEENPLIEISVEDAPQHEIKGYGLNIDKQYIKIMFRDHGVGFDPKYTEDAFKLFKRLHDIDTGTGIGLALCKKIVENHGGHISVTSQLNQGTTFYVILPVS